MPKKYITKKAPLEELEWETTLRVSTSKGFGEVYIPKQVIEGLGWKKGEPLYVRVFGSVLATQDMRKLTISPKDTRIRGVLVEIPQPEGQTKEKK
jgi:hypothetical protein